MTKLPKTSFQCFCPFFFNRLWVRDLKDLATLPLSIPTPFYLTEGLVSPAPIFGLQPSVVTALQRGHPQSRRWWSGDLWMFCVAVSSHRSWLSSLPSLCVLCCRSDAFLSHLAFKMRKNNSQNIALVLAFGQSIQTTDPEGFDLQVSSAMNLNWNEE